MSTPKHTPVQSRVIANDDLSAVTFRTYARLVMAAWRHDFQFTDWLTQGELVQLIGLDWSNIKRHMTELKRAGLVEWKTNGKNGRRFFILEVRLEESAKAHFCAPSSSGGGINSINNKDLLLPDTAQNCASDLIIDTEAWAVLKAMGIGEPARTVLSNRPNVTARYVRAMAAQARRDGVEIGALIYRMRNDWPAPDWCDQCGGLDGQHTDACPTQAARRAEISPADDCTQSAPAPAAAISTEMRLWQQVLGELQLQLPGATYETWLRRTSLVSADAGTYVIGVHNSYAKDWMENRLAPMIQRTLAGIVEGAVELRFIVKGGGV